VDVKGQVKIWNYKTGSLFQVVNQDQKLNSLVNGVVSLSALRFAVLTRKLTFYNLPVVPDIIQNQDFKHQAAETCLVERAVNDYRDALVLPAIDCIFCEIYQTFICASKNALRVYRA
jgi:hypothetical protein